MSFNEPYFAPMSNYSNQNKGVSMDAQEAWLDQFPQKRSENRPNGGIIQSLADTREIFLRPMDKKDRAAAIAQARREHKQALKNLAKQETQDTKEITKQLTKWKREAEQKERAELAAKKALLAKELKAKEVANTVKRKKKRQAHPKVADRLNGLQVSFLNGDFIEVKDCMGSKVVAAAYQMQRTDINALRKKGMRIFRAKNIRTGVNHFFFDNLPRYDGNGMSGLLHTDDGHELVKAINSGLVVEVSKLNEGVKASARSMLKLVEQYNIDISTIFNGRHTVGWILMSEQ